MTMFDKNKTEDTLTLRTLSPYTVITFQRVKVLNENKIVLEKSIKVIAEYLH